MRHGTTGPGRRSGTVLVAVVTLLGGVVAPATAAGDPLVAPVTEPGNYGVGSITTDVLLAHRDTLAPVEVWYPTDEAASASLPLAEHRFPPGVVDAIRHQPVDVVVGLFARAGLTDATEVIDLLDRAGLRLGLGEIRPLVAMLRMMGITELGEVLSVGAIAGVGELLDLLGLGGVLASVAAPVDAPTARLAAPLAAGDHPLVVFSHDLGALRWQSLGLVEHLASHGYVVVAADHPGTAFGDRIAFEDLAASTEVVDRILADRTRDVTALIDAVADGAVLAGHAGRVVTDEVAIVGHGVGGLTAMSAASGRERGGVAVAADARIASLVALAPLTDAGGPLIEDAELAAIEQPTLLVGAMSDAIAPIEPNTSRPYELLGGERTRIDVAGAAHDVFADAFPGLDLDALLGLDRGTLDGLLPPRSAPVVAPDHLAGPFVDDEAVRSFTTGVVAAFLLGTLPVGGVVPDADLPPPAPDPVTPPPTSVPLPAPSNPTPGDGGLVFRDVDRSNVHHAAIVELVDAGIVRGFADGTFRPGGQVTRAQLAAVIARVMGLTPAGGLVFADVAGTAHAGDIAALVAAGVINGFDDGTFRPNEPVRRDHVAAILARWLEVPADAAVTFEDLERNTHAGAIAALHRIGVVHGITEDRFGPERLLQRDQLASLVVRARPHAS